MKLFSALQSMCAANVTDGVPSQRTIDVELYVFIEDKLNKLLEKQSRSPGFRCHNAHVTSVWFVKCSSILSRYDIQRYCMTNNKRNGQTCTTKSPHNSPSRMIDEFTHVLHNCFRYICDCSKTTSCLFVVGVSDKSLTYSPSLCIMMASSNGNIFGVTGTLCGEFTGPGEFPTKASDAELWCFLWSASE